MPYGPPLYGILLGMFLQIWGLNISIWLRLQFVIRIASRKSPAIWDSVNQPGLWTCLMLWLDAQKFGTAILRRFEWTLKSQVGFGFAMTNRWRVAIHYLEHMCRVFGEGVKSAKGEIAILGRGDHTRNMFGTSLHTAYCRQTALETAERVQWFFDHCELLRRMNYCTNYCDGKQLLQRHPLQNPPLLRTPKC